jgi:hypothetical protein
MPGWGGAESGLGHDFLEGNNFLIKSEITVIIVHPLKTSIFKSKYQEIWKF